MKTENLLLPAFAIILTVVVSGCTVPPAAFAAKDDSMATSEGVATVVNANNNFAIDLYNKLSSSTDNVFFSPYSISSALAMTYEGAKGQTAEEMENVLYLPADENVLRSSYARLYNEINAPSNDYKLSTANALWAQNSYPFQQAYLNNVENYYGGKITNLDFMDVEGSRQTINKWVEDNTNKKIKDLIPQGALSTDTRFVLTNAIYFKGTWLYQFKSADTQKMDFHTSSGIVQADMMFMNHDQERIFNYTETDDLQMLELPYDGGKVSMLVVLPKEGKDLSGINLTVQNLEEWKSMSVNKQVIIYLPKFTFETKYFMKDTLSAMGMPTLFAPDADLSGMAEGLFVSQVIHQAFIDVNEEGTEAAAATAVIGVTAISPMEIPIFRADRPFVFLIQQKETGDILFMGIVNNPIA